MDPTATVIYVVITVFLATLTQSTFGFGNALVAMPLLFLVMDRNLATPLVAMVALTVAITVTLSDWRDINFSSARNLIVASLCGIPLGILWLKEAPVVLVKGGLGILVIGFSVFNLFTPKTPYLPKDWPGIFFGFSAGILGGAYNTGGPPVVIFGTLRAWSREQFRATIQGFFVPNGIMVVCGHWMVNLWWKETFSPREALGFYVICLPVAFLAVLIGRGINRRFSPQGFRRVIYAILPFLGTTLLVQACWDAFH